MSQLPNHGLTSEERGDTVTGRRRMVTFIVIALVIVAGVLAIAIASNRISDDGAAPAAKPSATATRPPTAASPSQSDVAQAAIVDAEDVRIWGAVSHGTRTAHGVRTLVLDKRAEGAYSLKDLIRLGAATRSDRTVVTLRQPVVIRSGATLKLHAPGQTLRLASTDKGFASIVAWGGSLTISGSAKSAMNVVGWDSAKKAPDRDMADGRGYLRAHSGTLSMRHVDLHEVGFWSGRTGGAASTGTTFDPGHAQVKDSTIHDSHIGLYLSNTKKATISRSTITGSDRFGIEMDRSRRVHLNDVTINHAALSGLYAHDHSSQLRIEASMMSHNGGYGISIDGRPQADGPNTLGYGVNNGSGLTIQDTTVEGNGSGGIQVAGTDKVVLETLTVTQERRPLRILGRSSSTVIERNDLTAVRGPVITIKDQALDVAIRSNTLSSNTSGIDLSSSQVEVTRNDLTIAKGSAITATGASSRGHIRDNTVTGKGLNPFNISEAAGQVAVDDNTAKNWKSTHPAIEWIERNPFAPLWLAILLIPLIGVIFIVKRYQRHRDLRRLTEDTVIAMTRARRLGKVPVPAPAAVPAPVAEPGPVMVSVPALVPEPTLTQPSGRTDRLVVRGAMGQFASAEDLAVHAVLEAGRSPENVARTLQVSEAVVRNWVRQHLAT